MTAAQEERGGHRRSVIVGRHYGSGRRIEITLDGGTIAAVTELSDEAEPEKADGDLWLAPGLVDLQVNGGMGIDFNTLPLHPGRVSELSRRLLAGGVTSFCPTLITNSFEAIAEAAAAIAAAARLDPAGAIAGIHLEGPFLSPEDGPRGAHPAEHIRPPDWDEFRRWQDAAEGRIAIVTISPEWPEAPGFIARCGEAGVIASIGHTAASPEQIREAVAAGARMSTHLGNGAHLSLPRHPNYLLEQLAADELYGCMIADGFHLPPALLKIILRMKKERAILVSDAVSLSGMTPGRYKLHIGGEVVLTEEGRLHLAGNPGLLAGSAMQLADQVSYLLETGLAGLEEAWNCASLHPAALLNLPQAAGLAAGAPADLVGFRREGARLKLEGSWKNGIELPPHAERQERQDG
ncbi:amidohydrolase family protein [Saccharibacillus sp. CPCC 101409]|uniref:N-acetylglucosamine-6-phosphate deacetylase n=1 Tax=Saccharibacillus sp. CPCC 101409 TaxID=3058041 RepID=UPI0026712405|nr:amidohydrolase family protein [Saccharibacillus sp. CPCC 101409]MDO3411093.1 amidohydrolase family protein [Saccharibacillus sp. CPCC 101409]